MTVLGDGCFIFASYSFRPGLEVVYPKLVLRFSGVVNLQGSKLLNLEAESKVFVGRLLPSEYLPS